MNIIDYKNSHLMKKIKRMPSKLFSAFITDGKGFYFLLFRSFQLVMYVTNLEKRKFNFEKGMWIEKSANKVEKEREHKILWNFSRIY